MSPGAKLFLALAGAGTLFGIVALAGSKSASAAPAKPKPQVPGSNEPPDVIVPPPGAQQPATPAQPAPPVQLPQLPQLPAQLPQLPQVLPPLVQQPATPAQPSTPAQPNPQAQVPPGVTVSLPNPLGGAPLGTFDPATGNVFGPNGIIIGTFDPNSGIFTAATGQQVKIPGFGPSTPAAQQPPPVVPVLPPAPPLPSLPSQPAPVQVQPPVSAPVTTVKSDTAAMVSALLDAETRAGWNVTDPNVLVFQKARGLTADSKFGPGTALAAALELGTLPLIRFWPLGTTKQKALDSYKAALLDMANKSPDPNHAQQLRLSAAREDARAYSTKGKLAALPVDMQVALAKVA